MRTSGIGVCVIHPDFGKFGIRAAAAIRIFAGGFSVFTRRDARL